MTEGTNRLSVAIVDDEPLARLRLRSLVESCPEPPARVVGEAGDAGEAQRLLAATTCDVVLLDIAMPGASGLRFADWLRHQPDPPAVVFVTAHGEHALRAFEVEAVDYLTKPVRRERLQEALLRVAHRRARAAPPSAAGPVLVASDRGRVVRIPAAEVIYLKAEQKYVTLVSRRGNWLLDEPLAELEQRLGSGFVRVHRNAVVAMAEVRSLTRRRTDTTLLPLDDVEPGGEGEEGWQVQMSNDDRLAVSRRQLPAVRAALAAAGGSR